MSQANNALRICGNGHESNDAIARFCVVCGASLNFMRTEKPPIPLRPSSAAPPVARQSQSPPANQTPVNYPQHPNQNPPPNFNRTPTNNPAYFPPPNYNQYQPQNYAIAPQFRAVQCQKCGDDGSRLPEKVFICPECRWLRPLAPGYAIDRAAFQWAEDGKAMSVLRSIKALNSAAKTISHKVGRRWIEVTLSGVLLSEKQLPDIYFQAVRAARILGVPNMPDVYVSGEYAWDCHTYGSDKDAFIVVGSALAANFSGAEMLFLLAREMGHVRAGHALWKSVLKFLVGEQPQHKSIMSGGILGALSPTALLESAFEMPLLGWARQAEITADRAGMLAVGDEEIARRVLLSWSLKSTFLYRRINVAAWLEQQAAGDDGATKLSELVSTSTPYITRRLSLMEKFARSEELRKWRGLISRFAPPQSPNAAPNQKTAQPPRPAKPAPPASANIAAPPKKAAAPNAASGEIKMKCSACNAPMRVPRKVLQGKSQVNVRCPNAACGKVLTLKQNPRRLRPGATNN